MVTAKISIGTRNSKLALIQATHISTLLSTAHPTLAFPVQTVLVRGDADKTSPFLSFQSQSQSQSQGNKTIASDAAKNLWTEEMEILLGKGELDLLQHCLKDMPTSLPNEYVLGAVLEREDPTDAVVMKSGWQGGVGLEDLPDGAVVGTSSTRRKALVKRLFPGLVVRECRGNV
jgi:hydroxymethylbilane synthase